MVESQRRDGHSCCPGDGGCIKPATQSSLQDSQPDIGFSESEQGYSGDMFEKSWQRCQLSFREQSVGGSSDLGRVGGEICFRNLAAANSYSFSD